MEQKTIQVTAYLDAVLLGKLKAMAVADDRSLSYLLERAAREMIAKPENVVKWRQVDLEEQIAAKHPAARVKTSAKRK